MGTSNVNPKRVMYLPTVEACESYNFRRIHSSYGLLNPDASGKSFFQGALDRLATLSQNAIGAPIFGVNGPGENQKTFLAGPQFRNKPGNLLQDVAARFTLGIYNGPESSYWSSKLGQEDDDEDGVLEKLRRNNSVTITAISNKPYKIRLRKQTIAGEEVTIPEYSNDPNGSNGSEALWWLNILPNWNQDEAMEFNHEHEWGKPDGDIFTSILSTVGQIAAGGARLAQRIQEFRETGGTAPTGPQRIVRATIADTYQSSSKISLDIPFTLFTKNNFYRDIFGPIMLLNFLTHPRRTSLDEALKEFGGNSELAQSVLGNINSSLGNQATDQSGQVTAASTDDLDVGTGSQLNNFLNSVIPGFRIFSAEPPSYFNIEHSAGLFSFKNCVITNFSYRYFGPWVTTTNHPQDQKAGGPNNQFSGTAGGNPVRGQNKDWWEFWKTENDIKDSKWTRVKLTYPLKAECSLTVRTVEPVFAEDWLQILSGYREIFSEEGQDLPDVNNVGGDTDLLNLGGLI